MPIKYYWDRTQKKSQNPYEELQHPNKIISENGTADITSAGLDVTIAPVWSAEVQNVSIYFDTSTERAYEVQQVAGRGIVAGLNDMLHIHVDGGPYQVITLTPGFYETGALLAAEIKARLDENQTFIDLTAVPFTVSFSTSTDKFTIAPDNSLNMHYYNKNARTNIRTYSTAGPVIGFNADASGTSITSDTAVLFGNIGSVIPSASDTNQNVTFNSPFPLSVDKGIKITTGTAAGTVANYQVDYKLLPSV